MRSVTRHTGKLEIIERLKISDFGNPRFLCCIDGYVFRTAPDSQYSYSIENYRDKVITVTLGIFYGYLTLNSIEKG